ncbi:MAG: hypothetical protein PHS53_02995 [Candidatus Pacebacteria bacterium]|nr:hypothetical protein [Candidatus Paceibacterota bacterium]MDD5357086.1 hypothetical protein [Candidatus Paceibacterota bacterium]
MDPSSSFLEYFFGSIIDFITNFSVSDILDSLSSFYATVKIIGIILSLILIFLCIYAEINLLRVEREEDEHERHLREHYKAHHGHGSGQPYTNTRWLKIVDHINSKNPSDWRLAILEADIILDEMLSKMAYHGETVSDKLKSIDESQISSINSAWEAHKIRNAIAHEGSDFLISEREARRVIGLYEKVFKEFHFI